MDKKTLVDRFSPSDEKRTVFAHLLDLMERRDNRNIVISSDFLSVSDVISAEQMLDFVKCNSYFSFGGYSESERKCIVFLPDYLTKDDIISDSSLADFEYILASVSVFDESRADFSHRDVLGSIMSLGVERGSIGDIVTDGGKAVIIVKSKIALYLKENLNRIGRYPVNIELYDKYDICPKIDYEIETDTVSSMRLDAVVAAIFGMSRSAATEYIDRGLVTINSSSNLKQDLSVKQGDCITVRGKGRAIIESNDGLSKKGKVKFKFRKYK